MENLYILLNYVSSFIFILLISSTKFLGDNGFGTACKLDAGYYSKGIILFLFYYILFKKMLISTQYFFFQKKKEST